MPWHGKSIPPSDFYLMEDEYKLTTKFYVEFIVAFCRALDLRKPVVMGQSMGGNVCLALALRYESEFSALIALEACDHSPGWWIDPLHHPHIHGGEVVATSVFGLMSPRAPTSIAGRRGGTTPRADRHLQGDLYFYSVDSDFRDQVHKISGKLPIYFSPGVRLRLHAGDDRAHRRAGEELRVHHLLGRALPTSEDPAKFKDVVTPVLKKIVTNDPERRGQGGQAAFRSTGSEGRSSGRNERPVGRRVIDL